MFVIVTDITWVYSWLGVRYQENNFSWLQYFIFQKAGGGAAGMATDELWIYHVNFDVW